MHVKTCGLLSLLSLLLVTSCIDTTSTGEEFIQNEILNSTQVVFTPTVSNYGVDSIDLHRFDESDNIFLNISSIHSLGHYDDPEMGMINVDLLLKPALRNIGATFSTPVVDSVILRLDYAPEDFTGDITQPFKVKAYSINEPLEREQDYFVCDDCFVWTEGTLLADETITIDTSNVLSEDGLTSTLKQFELHLDPVLFQTLLEDDENFAELSNFDDAFEGLFLVTDTDNSATLAFNTNFTTSVVEIYYTDGDVNSSINMDFPFDYPKTYRVTHDETTALGLRGLTREAIRLEIPIPDSIQGKVINLADLKMKAMDHDSILQPLPESFLAYRIGENGELIFTDDINETSDIDFYFGGFLEDDGFIHMNLTKYYQNLADGVVEDDIVIDLVSAGSTAERIIVDQIDLTVTYTDIE